MSFLMLQKTIYREYVRLISEMKIAEGRSGVQDMDSETSTISFDMFKKADGIKHSSRL